MPKDIKKKGIVKGYKELAVDYDICKNGRLAQPGHILPFEAYYRDLLKDRNAKGAYKPPILADALIDFLENLLATHEANEAGKLDEAESNGFEELKVTIQEDKKHTLLVKLMRTVLLDTYDTLAGDLDNPENAENLNKAILLTDLFDSILVEQDKKDIRGALRDGKAEKLLMEDQEMDGSFSRTLKALYRKYAEARKTGNEEEKEKWNKLCRSYAVRPYMNAIEKKVKQEDFEKLPEEEKEQIRQKEALRKEAKELQLDPEKFLKLSDEERKKIRETAAQAKFEADRKKNMAELQAELEAAEMQYHIDRVYFTSAPKLLMKKYAALNEETKKDSQAFKDMRDSLVTLCHTEDYRQMDKLVAEGRTQELTKNIEDAVKFTQDYITYASNKSFMQMGTLGRKRLHAAQETLRELQTLQQTIQDEQAFMQDIWRKRVRLAAEEDVDKRLAKQQKEAQQKEDLKKQGMKMSVVQLRSKVEGKKTGAKNKTTEWVVLEHTEGMEKKNNGIAK